MGKSGREETALNLCIAYFIQLYLKFSKFVCIYRGDINIVLISIIATAIKNDSLLTSQMQGKVK